VDVEVRAHVRLRIQRSQPATAVHPPVSFPYGAAHQAETQYLFDLPTAPFPKPLSAPQETLASTMRSYWSTFVAHGAPSAPGAPQWAKFGGDTQRMMSLLAPKPVVASGFAVDHKCGFWAQASS
jgi:para-nitrobenzyl esterase